MKTADVMKRVLNHIAARRVFVAPIRRRLASGGVTVFMYHDLGDDDDDVSVWQVVKVGEFRRQIDYLREHYDIVSLDDALSLVSSPRQSDRPLAVLTFDDGLRGNHGVLLPIIRELQLPVTVYVATEHIETQIPAWTDRIVNALQAAPTSSFALHDFGLGLVTFDHADGPGWWGTVQCVLEAGKELPRSRALALAASVEQQAGRSTPVLAPLTLAQLQELGREPLVTIGSHTHGHELLTMLHPDEAVRTIKDSIERLERWTGREVRHFAYPNGSYHPSTVSIVGQLQLRSATTVRKGIWRPGGSPFEIPRIPVSRFDSLDRFITQSVLGGPSLARHLVRARNTSRGAGDLPLDKAARVGVDPALVGRSR